MTLKFTGNRRHSLYNRHLGKRGVQGSPPDRKMAESCSYDEHGILKELLEKTTEIDNLLAKLDNKCKPHLEQSAMNFQKLVLDCISHREREHKFGVASEVVITQQGQHAAQSKSSTEVEQIVSVNYSGSSKPKPQDSDDYIECPTCHVLVLSEWMVSHAAEAHQQIVELIDVPWTDTSDGFTEIVKSTEPKDGNYRCKLCEIKHRLDRTDSDEVCLTDLPYYSNKDELFKHIDQIHSKVSLRLINSDGQVAVKGTNLITIATGELVPQSKRWLYCELACAHCEVRKRVGHSLQKAYYWLCNHLNRSHDEDLPHDAATHYCDRCHYQSHSLKLLREHFRYNHLKTKMKRKEACPDCGKVVLSRFMTKHRSIKHGVYRNAEEALEKRIPCPVCDKMFTTLNNQENHFKRVHLNLRDAQCDKCDARFFEQSQLEIHLFSKHGINQNNKPELACQVEGCDFITIRVDVLNKHALTHVTTGTHLCEHCSKTFKTLNNLKQHLLVKHTTEQKFECKKCDFKTHARQYLLRHERMHVKDKPYKCDFGRCKYESHYRENLVKHKKRVHSVVEPAAKRTKVQQPEPEIQQHIEQLPPEHQYLPTQDLSQQQTNETLESLVQHVTSDYPQTNNAQQNIPHEQYRQIIQGTQIIEIPSNVTFSNSLDLISSVTASQAKINVDKNFMQQITE